MTFDWLAKLRHLALTVVFCLGVAALHHGFVPERPALPPVMYSLCIGLITWVLVDIGRHAIPSAQETGWPAGWEGVALVVGAITAGYLGGNAIADALCREFGWYAGQPVPDRAAEARVTILISAVAGVVGTFYFYSANKSRYLERKMGEARQLATESRLKLLEAQLEPHMLFNTLANLRALIGTDPPRAQQMLDHLIDYLRATLGASRGTVHPLADEFARLQDYLALMAIRMGPRLQYALHLPPALAAQPVPTLLLQPLVENAIRHGLEPQVDGGRIEVEARAEAGALVLEVRDTGAGPQASAQHAPGFGLAQVRERLQTLYGTHATIELIAGGAGGTLARARFPLKT